MAKKRIEKLLPVLIAVCCLTACGSTTAANKDTASQTETDFSTSQAYETNQELSVEEKEQTEKERREEIAEQYSIYAPYGMTYNSEKDRFFYNGQMVRFFRDEISIENTNSFFFEDGVIDVDPIRNADGNLTGLKQSSDSDFNARTEKQEKMKAELEAAGISGDSGSFEIGDLNYCDDSLEAYISLGISYDKTAKEWIYDGKAIHIFYDADHITYYSNGINDGINLKVVRDKNGNIESLVEVDEQELIQFVK